MSAEPLPDIYDNTLAVFGTGADAAEPLTTPEVADALDLNRRTAYKRLENLVDRGDLKTKSTGSRSRVWWRPLDLHGDEVERLERCETIIEAIGDPVYELDSDGCFTFVNRALAEQSGYDRTELLGESASIVVGDDDFHRASAVIRDLLSDPRSEATTIEYEGITKDGDRLPVENHITLLTDDDGRFKGTVGVVRDVSDRKAQERRLEETKRWYRTLVDTFPNGIVAPFDDDLRYLIAGGQLYDSIGFSPEETVGKTIYERLPPDHVELQEPRYRATLDGESDSFITEYAGQTVQIWTVPVIDDQGGVIAGMAMSQDITDRTRHQQELEKRIEQLERIATFGQQAIGSRDLDQILGDAAQIVAETLENEYCKVLKLDEDVDELLLSHGVGWNEGIVGSMSVSAVEQDSQAAYTLASRHPIVVEDLATESRFRGPELLTSHDVRSGISTIIGPFDEPWGILGTHDTTVKEFSENDVNFVQAIANILSTAITHHKDREELERQRSHLASLVSLNVVVREMIEALIEQSTREEIEQVVCDQLTSTNSYTAAWIADIDQTSEEVTPRVQAGTTTFADDHFLPAIQECTIEALSTGCMQVAGQEFIDCHHGMNDPLTTRAFAAIPIVHEDVLYGVIGLYSGQEDAFDSWEQDILDELGEIVGYAVAGIKRKHALLSESVTEIELAIPDIFDAFDVNPMDGTIRITRAVPIAEEEYLVYGVAAEESMDTVLTLVGSDGIPQWQSIETLGKDGETTRFELRLGSSKLLAAISASNGFLSSAIIEEGDCSVTLFLPVGTDIQKVIQRIKQDYPKLEMVTRRQTTRSRDVPRPLREVCSGQLTSRQMTVLEAGYFAGYFDSPRERSGEEVAESLGITASTFHQHVLRAQKNILDAAFATS